MKEHLSGDASPTERTMSWLREQGYTVDKVEQKVRRNVTRDFCGFADVIAFKADVPGALAVQATAGGAAGGGGHLKERCAKIAAEPRAKEWLAAQNHIWVVAWTLRGEPGKRKTYGAPDVVEFQRPCDPEPFVPPSVWAARGAATPVLRSALE